MKTLGILLAIVGAGVATFLAPHDGLHFLIIYAAYAGGLGGGVALGIALR